MLRKGTKRKVVKARAVPESEPEPGAPPPRGAELPPLLTPA